VLPTTNGCAVFVGNDDDDGTYLVISCRHASARRIPCILRNARASDHRLIHITCCHLVVADEHRAAVSGRQHALDLHFNDVVFHGAIINAFAGKGKPRSAGSEKTIAQ